MVGLPSFAKLAVGRAWINNVSTACYAVASSSGSLYFALNFADECSAPVTSWVFRACIIQGTQQAFAAGLWYWGHSLAALSAAGMLSLEELTTSTTVTMVAWPIGALLIAIGVCLFVGLPDYYRRLPGGIPAFYKSLTRRKLVLVICLFGSINHSGFSFPLCSRISGSVRHTEGIGHTFGVARFPCNKLSL